MSAGELLIAFTLGAAALALWSYVRWPGAAPATMKGAVLRVLIALALLQVGAGVLDIGVGAAPFRRDPGRGRRGGAGADLRVPRVDLVHEDVRRPDATAACSAPSAGRAASPGTPGGSTPRP